MVRYIVVSIFSGMVFAILDGFINANPLAQELFKVFKPIARTSINIPAGMVIDLTYGFIMAGIFLILHKGIPGKSGWLKGFNYGLIIWFFRVVMYVITIWMMFNVPSGTLFYMLVSGLGEMLVIGLVYGFLLKPET